MKRKIAILSLIVFTLAALLSFLQMNKWLPISMTVIETSWWVFTICATIYAILNKKLTSWILVSMVIGIQIGFAFPEMAKNLDVLSKVFLRLIKTIIAPILFSTLVVGIAGHSNLKQLGRMGWKSLLYFEVVTTFALLVGLVMINLTQAGVGIQIPSDFHEELPKVMVKTWQDHIVEIFPENIIKSIYHGDVLPIVVFSVIFGIGLAMLPSEKKEPLLKFTESLAETMFKFTNIIMYFAPLGVCGAIAATTSHLGLGILFALFKLVLTLYISLFVFSILILIPIALFIKLPLKTFIAAISEPVSIAFATSSSESALPKAMENMEKIGVPRKIVSFVMPTGYTFNLDGTTLYLSLAAVFVAQAAGMHLSIGEQLMIGVTLMLTSKGVAGVSRASLVILLGVAAQFNLPLWPIMAILGVDVLMDMARTSINVTGNCLASAVVARWEGELDDEKLKEGFKED